MGIQRIIIILVSFLVFSAASELADIQSSGTCSAGSCEQSGEALLQVARHTSSQAMPASISEIAVRQHVVKRENQTKPDKITGANAKLHKGGYEKVKKLCCGPEMATFITRYITEKMKKKVCEGAQGGVSGLAVWHDCKEDGSTWDGFKQALKDAQKGDCPFISDNGICTRSDNCAKYPGETFDPCKPELICCANPDDVKDIDIPQRDVAPSTGWYWDCNAHPEALQVLYDDKKDKQYHLSKLHFPTGTYDNVWKIPHYSKAPNPTKGIENMNSFGINPKDKRLYATIKGLQETVNGKKRDQFYLVRFSDTELEYLARMPPPAEYSCTGYNAGAFSLSGTFYITSNPTPWLHIIENVHTLDGFKDLTDAGLPIWEKANFPIPATKLVGSGTADIVALPANFDKSGRADYVILLDSDSYLILYQTKTKKIYKLKSEGASTGVKWGYGAGWNYKGKLYFSANNGDGVYQIDKKSIKLEKDGLDEVGVRLTRVGKSASTTRNDGANCLDQESPWPGECKDPQIDIPPVNGECPVWAPPKP